MAAASSLLMRPAAAEVRAMLQKIKLDNMERGRKVAGRVISSQLIHNNGQSRNLVMTRGNPLVQPKLEQ